jgi:nucleotide-binding universal stress UspA family protein
MTSHPSVLCPVDFSDASRGALRYAARLAEFLKAELTVVTVTDPLLTEAAEFSGAVAQLPEAVRKELYRFCEDTFEHAVTCEGIRFEVVTGKPAVEILRLAHDRPADVIVMSTHGLTGVRKLFFGSTTERVLRETTVPILLTPAHDQGPTRFDDIRRAVRRVLVPVDLTAATIDQVSAARDVAAVLDVPVVLAYVVEPVRFAVSGPLHLPNVDVERRFRAEKGLAELVSNIPPNLRPEALVAYGDPAEEIAKVARDRDVGLIVIGLHASSLLGPRMGSVTYRVLCLTSTLVLALPPGIAAALSRASVAEDAQVNPDTTDASLTR